MQRKERMQKTAKMREKQRMLVKGIEKKRKKCKECKYWKEG